ncbi:unnamed protein product [Sphenostylis stenocarpa]|uniref:Uncharacterized protein n=1 Tax=Sphenostylis stenocarpa TaxID=92480 RepID=A0AA86V7W1_9FABA|nr:unnamed protein product [Sphenostylis stenocarpa]
MKFSQRGAENAVRIARGVRDFAVSNFSLFCYLFGLFGLMGLLRAKEYKIIKVASGVINSDGQYTQMDLKTVYKVPVKPKPQSESQSVEDLR